MKNLEEFLSKKANSPTPHIQADYFLATRIAAQAEGEKEILKTNVLPGWSMASIITTLAILLGIYLGSGILESNSVESNSDIVSEYSEAFYQSGFADNYTSAIDNGGTNK